MGNPASLRAALIGKPVPTPAELIRGFPDLGRLRLRRGGLLPRVGGWFLGKSSVAAITLGNTVFLAPHTAPGAMLLLHELRHAEQFSEHRSFPLRYIWESMRRGYHRNRYEAEARQYSARRVAVTESALAGSAVSEERAT